MIAKNSCVYISEILLSLHEQVHFLSENYFNSEYSIIPRQKMLSYESGLNSLSINSPYPYMIKHGPGYFFVQSKQRKAPREITGSEGYKLVCDLFHSTQEKSVSVIAGKAYEDYSNERKMKEVQRLSISDSTVQHSQIHY